MTCFDVITETAHVHFQTKMTNSDKMDRFSFGSIFSNYFSPGFSRFLLVPNCLNSADKFKAISANFMSSLRIRLQKI